MKYSINFNINNNLSKYYSNFKNYIILNSFLFMNLSLIINILIDII